MHVALPRHRVRVLRAASGLLCLTLLASCATTPARATEDGKVLVIAAESFWGSLASAIGGDRVTVINLINNPVIDPHDYEPTAADARAFTAARVVIVNGVGYDGWAIKLLRATPSKKRVTINVGNLVGAARDANPHLWYDPSNVTTVINEITRTYAAADPQHATYFNSQRAQLGSAGLAHYEALIAEIKATYGGTPVGASESIFAPLAQALDLRLLTPSTFLRAVGEGVDPTASDKREISEQIRDREIKVYVYNAQNATPDVRDQLRAARAAGIPVVAITETPTPANRAFIDWQISQLEALRAALAHGEAL